MEKAEKIKLISIRFSHYVEKVRWTMDRLRVAYVEKPLMPIVHFLYAPFYIGVKGSGDRHSTRFSTPILIDEKGKRIQKSSVIMKYINQRFADKTQNLFPNDEVSALDEHYNRYLGPHVRRIFYFTILQNQEQIFFLADKNVDAKQARLFKRLFPLAKQWILRGLKVHAAQVEKGRGYVYKEFEAVEKKLSDGRPFLMGDKFTAADISFACLGGAILLPSPKEGYGAFLPTIDAPLDFTKMSRELRTTPVGKWVLNLYQTERGQRQIEALPLLR